MIWCTPALATLPPPPDPKAKPLTRTRPPQPAPPKHDATCASSTSKSLHKRPEFAAAFSHLIAGVPSASHLPAWEHVGGNEQTTGDGSGASKGAQYGNASGAGGAGVKVALAFDMEMHDIAGIEESFKDAVAHDLADAVGGRRDRIHIAHVLPGSIPYTLASFVDIEEGVCGQERRALNVARDLERQAAEDSSLLKCGRYTAKIISVRTLAPIVSTDATDGGVRAAGEGGGGGYLAKSYLAKSMVGGGSAEASGGDKHMHRAASDPLLQFPTATAANLSDGGAGGPGPAPTQGHSRFAFPPVPTDDKTLTAAPPDAWASLYSILTQQLPLLLPLLLLPLLLLAVYLDSLEAVALRFADTHVPQTDMLSPPLARILRKTSRPDAHAPSKGSSRRAQHALDDQREPCRTLAGAARAAGVSAHPQAVAAGAPCALRPQPQPSEQGAHSLIGKHRFCALVPQRDKLASNRPARGGPCMSRQGRDLTSRNPAARARARRCSCSSPCSNKLSER